MLSSLLHSEPQDYLDNLFIGLVVDNNDPDKNERVRVTIPGLYEGDIENLPWVAPAVSKNFGNKAGQGYFSVPSLGTELYVMLQRGDPLHPMYIGSPVSIRSSLPESDVNYPNRYGFKDPAGNLFMVDTTPGVNTATFTHASGTSFSIQNNGNILVHCVGSINSDASSWTHVGPVNIVGDVDITGNIDVTGNIDATGVITGVTGVRTPTTNLNTHVHSGVRDGPNTSGPPFPNT